MPINGGAGVELIKVAWALAGSRRAAVTTCRGTVMSFGDEGRWWCGRSAAIPIEAWRSVQLRRALIGGHRRPPEHGADVQHRKLRSLVGDTNVVSAPAFDPGGGITALFAAISLCSKRQPPMPDLVDRPGRAQVGVEAPGNL